MSGTACSLKLNAEEMPEARFVMGSPGSSTVESGVARNRVEREVPAGNALGHWKMRTMGGPEGPRLRITQAGLKACSYVSRYSSYP